MPNLIVQENGAARTRAAEHGEEITINSPCDCTAVTGVQIAGEVFDFCDACGNSLAGKGDLFAKGNLVRVLIDTVNGRAIIVNRAVTPKQIGAAEADHKHHASEIENVGLFECIEYVGTGTVGEDNPVIFTFGFAPKLLLTMPVATISSPTTAHIYDMGAVTTEYQQCIGGTSDSKDVYMKKSSDGKTVYIQIGKDATATNHYNNEGRTHRWFAFA